MITYMQNGTKLDVPFINTNTADFWIQEIDAASDRYVYPGDEIQFEINSALRSLRDKFQNILFTDTNKYYAAATILPEFLLYGGYESSIDITSEQYANLINDLDDNKMPDIFRRIYLIDCEFLIDSLQNHIVGIESLFINYYMELAKIDLIKSEDGYANSIYMVTSNTVRYLSSTLESFFTKAYSTLDILCKITYELFNRHTKFDAYKKLKSANKLWGDRNSLSLPDVAGTIFEDCELTTTIESLRNEVVHNGTWELIPRAFAKVENNTIIERYMLFPDISQGRLATVKNRKHFFGSTNKVNDCLKNIYTELLQRILSTINLLNSLEID